MPQSTLPAGFIAPMLPTLVDVAPDGGEWIHEIKYDGYRTQLVLAGKAARPFTRNGHDWTAKYAPVVAASQALRCRSAIIDGEMCVQNAAGVTDFKALRSSIRSAPERLVLFAFDLLMLDCRDLRAEPLVARRRRLQDLVGVHAAKHIASSGEHVGEGPKFYQAADQHGLEGIVSKRADSPYVSGRATSWLKVKSFTVGDFAVVGVERSSLLWTTSRRGIRETNSGSSTPTVNGSPPVPGRSDSNTDRPLGRLAPQGAPVWSDPHSDRPVVSFPGSVDRPGTPCGEALPRRCL